MRQGAHVELVATERGGVSGAAVLERMRRVAGHDDIDYNPVRPPSLRPYALVHYAPPG